MPNSIDSRDANAPWNAVDYPAFTEMELLKENISFLKRKMSKMVKKSDVTKILTDFESSPTYAIMQLKKIL